MDTSHDSPIGLVTTLARYPVKSMVGEDLESVEVSHRGVEDDRLWAVLDADGKLGSGKNTRRFRRMPGLLDLAASYPDGSRIPLVRFPDGRQLSGDDHDIHAALSAHVGRTATLGREADVSHFDEGPLHVVTTLSLARLGELHGRAVDARRFRANLVVDTGLDARFDEDEWVGRELAIGADIVVRVRGTMVRCVMVGLPQVDLAVDGGLLKTIGRVNDLVLGLVVDVLTPGTLRVGDAVRPLTRRSD